MKERDLHVAVIQFLSVALPAGAMTHHSPNEGKRGWKAQRDFKDLGSVTGFPDLVIFYAGRVYCLELKAPQKYLSPVQKVAHERLAKAGVPVAVCKSVTDVAMVLSDWGLPLIARVAA